MSLVAVTVTLTTSYIYTLRHWFKMFGIEATRCFAQMVNDQTVSDGANQTSVGKPVNVPELSGSWSSPDLAVAVSVS